MNLTKTLTSLVVLFLYISFPCALALHVTPLNSSYHTNFSSLEANLWAYDTTCFHCKKVEECTKNVENAVTVGSIESGAGVTIQTTRLKNLTSVCSGNAGGES